MISYKVKVKKSVSAVGSSLYYDKEEEDLYFSIMLEPNTIRLCRYNVINENATLISGLKGVLLSAIQNESRLYLLHSYGLAIFNKTTNKMEANIKKKIGKNNYMLQRITDNYLGITSIFSQSIKLFNIVSKEIDRSIYFPRVDLCKKMDTRYRFYSFWSGNVGLYDSSLKKIESDELPTAKDPFVKDSIIYVLLGRRSNDNSSTPSQCYRIKSLHILCALDSYTLKIVQQKEIPFLERLIDIDKLRNQIIGVTHKGIAYIDLETFDVIQEVPLDYIDYELDSMAYMGQGKVAILPFNMSFEDTAIEFHVISDV
ncbi:hypothetical protein [Spirochaeta cellobiosiphila]|uniref:hypothetical protein n=1 Tax=Spirochaeta cellobiosiphila TaxID=504483 RepID=UPI000428EE01|nr:hypothetical protein [Spirochaeta cellobiosiphila]